ncbi:hypothetical protein [Sporolactobacillus terrae]|uniref:NlpC/P60 domain-containing protein n=1 Tax=Sporolactobacillus terrae TaxID=269673 RepID=A0A5K7WTP1_9BACL|nr:hypothetical protein [Sporolactobacillus terrae]BBN97672.1 hypothetical protein St703_03770 [Sporolactobacillus terrae]
MAAKMIRWLLFSVYAHVNGHLVREAAQPKAGDIVFYSRYHATLVVGTHADGTYDEVGAKLNLIFVSKHVYKKWKDRDVARMLE